jgi:hypothetical protein
MSARNITFVPSLVLLLSIALASGNIALGGVLDPNYPRGFWRFDEGQGYTAYDSSGYGNHGTIYGASWTTGISGSALHFTGGTTADRVEVPDSSSLRIVDCLGLDAWVKPDINIEPNHPWSYNIIMKWHGSGDQWRTGYLLTIGTSKECGNLSCLYLLLGFGNGNYRAFNSTKDSWNAGQWYHIAATYDSSLSSGNVKLYVDGVLDTSYGETRSIATNDLPLFINSDPYEVDAGAPSPSVRYFPGVIDEARVIPEPATLSLLGLGGLAVIRRKRK